MSLEYHRKFNSNIDKDMGELRKDFEKLETDLSRSVNTKLGDRIISLERQCWINSQHSRCDFTGLPDNIKMSIQKKKTDYL